MYSPEDQKQAAVCCWLQQFAEAAASVATSASCKDCLEDVRILAVVVAKLELCQIQREIGSAHVVIRADDSAFEAGSKGIPDCWYALRRGRIHAPCGHGRSNFPKLVRQTERTHYYAFDLLMLGDVDLRAKPLHVRKAALADLLDGCSESVPLLRPHRSEGQSVLRGCARGRTRGYGREAPGLGIRRVAERRLAQNQMPAGSRFRRRRMDDRRR
jgi:hypothetical protein